MSSPATIPMTNQKSSITPISSQSQAGAPIGPSALSRLSSSLRQSLSNRRPLSELFDRSTFSRPESLSESTSRLRKNLSYFRVNYISFLTLILALSLISHPLSLLLLLCLLACWIFLYLFRPSDQPLVFFGRLFSDRETLGFLVLVTVVVVFLTTVGSLLISAILFGVALIAAHGAFRIPEDLFFDDPDPSSSAGLLSFLGGGASSSAAAAAASLPEEARFSRGDGDTWRTCIWQTISTYSLSCQWPPPPIDLESLYSFLLPVQSMYILNI